MPYIDTSEDAIKRTLMRERASRKHLMRKIRKFQPRLKRMIARIDRTLAELAAKTPPGA